MKPTPINVAEAIIAAFWEPGRRELAQWQVAPGQDHGLEVKQNWCWLAYSWQQAPASGPALSMSAELALDLSEWDGLVLSLALPPDTAVTLAIETDAGPRQRQFAADQGGKRELVLPLRGAQRLRRVTLTLSTQAAGPRTGWFNWLGLRQSALLPAVARQYEVADPTWPHHLRPASATPAYQPSYGLVINAAELAELRQEHAALLARDGSTPFTRAAEQAARLSPEGMVGEFINFWGDLRYNRERDHERPLFNHGRALAVAGLLCQRPDWLRLAARFALSLAHCTHWDDGMITRFPGGLFEHRCFVQSLCAYDIAFILDLAGDQFTWYGRDYLLRRLSEEGIGSITYTTWRNDYIFGCNQLAWFSPGRLLALLVLERHYPRVRDYTEIAWRELGESLERSILPDGGYVEGPSYFTCVGKNGGLSAWFYARARGLTLREAAPAAMRRTGDFAAAVISTVPAQDCLPICDGHARLDRETTTFMSAILPDSAWPAVLAHQIAREGEATGSVIAWLLQRQTPRQAAPPPPLLYLPAMGLLTSTRTLGEHQVKLAILGNHPGAGHTHEDKGSFILEFAGETFAMDAGIGAYGDPMVGLLKQAQRHNLLVPISHDGRRPAPPCPLPPAIAPQGTGNATRFTASVDLSPGWESWYRHWRRHFDSPTPATLTITDDYELAAGAGVQFLWHTNLPITVHGRQATLTGRAGTVTLTWPADCQATVSDLPVIAGIQQRQLAITRHESRGPLVIQATLAATPPPAASA